MEKEDFKLKTSGLIRVRMAPSPTGLFHIGGARTALFNYLFAKKNSGVFVLRIEDTDKERSKKEFEKDIIESLNWLWIQPDEGPDIKGNYGPYRQSKRKNIYAKYIQKLLEEDKAYYCFCPPEELKNHKNYKMSMGELPRYSGRCSNLSQKEVEKNLKEKKPFVIRFRITPRKVEFEDIIRGKIEFDASLIGDIVIAKNLDAPLYNLACVIDDYEMQISHVIRGEEHISNTPKQILIQEALNFARPQYAHLPLILGPDKSKLSKRHGATSVLEYKKQGYLPETLVNFIAFLGWNPGTEREIYSISSLVKEFSFERSQKSGAVFNKKRLAFLNGFYIRQKSLKKLTELCVPYLIENKLITSVDEIIKRYKALETKEEIGFEKIEKIVLIYQERLKKLSEIVELTEFFFKEKIEYDKELLKWKDMSDSDLKNSLDTSIKLFDKMNERDFAKNNISEIFLPASEKFSAKLGKKDRGCLLWPLRAALTGKKESAGPFEIAEILGKEKTLQRIKEAKKLFS